jgi:hypothetical protein
MMKRLLVFCLLGALAGAVLAQQYRWVDKDGRVQYGDSPPPGVKATRLGGAPAPAAPAAPAAAGSDAKTGAKAPPTPAEQDAAYRKRQQDAQKESEKSAQADRDKAQNKENCARSQEYLRSLEAGMRIAITDRSGERVYLDDEQRASETAKARQMVQQSCN